MTAGKLDLKQAWPDLYRVREHPELVDVPELAFLMIDGQGDPNTSQEYVEAVHALYSVSYSVKFAFRHADGGFDFTVMPLEGLWWVPDMTTFVSGHRSAWNWTMMIAQPDMITPEVVEHAREKAARKIPGAALSAVRLERFAEGRAAQLAHIGPYASEGPAVARLHAFIEHQGCRPVGKHHEIYLGDPARSAPENLKTLLRQPVEAR